MEGERMEGEGMEGEGMEGEGMEGERMEGDIIECKGGIVQFFRSIDTGVRNSTGK